MNQIQPTGRTEVTQADIEVAFNLLNEGKPPEESRKGISRGRGLDQATAAAILRDFMTRKIYSDAAQLLNNEVPPEDAVRQLVDNGVEPQFAKAVVDDLVSANRRPKPNRGKSRRANRPCNSSEAR